MGLVERQRSKKNNSGAVWWWGVGEGYREEDP